MLCWAILLRRSSHEPDAGVNRAGGSNRNNHTGDLHVQAVEADSSGCVIWLSVMDQLPVPTGETLGEVIVEIRDLLKEFLPAMAYGFAGISPDRFIFYESPEPVTIQPGETKAVIRFERDFPWNLTHIGCTDVEYARYRLSVGAQKFPITKEPLGLFNSPFNFSPPISVDTGEEVVYEVTLHTTAPSAQSFVGKVIGFRR